MKNARRKRSDDGGRRVAVAKKARPPVELPADAWKRRDSATTGTNSYTTKSTTNRVKPITR